MGKGFKGKSSTQDLIAERVLYLNSCHPRPRAGVQGNRQDLRKGKCHDTRYMWHGALGPRFRGDDNGGSRDDNGGSEDEGKGGWDDGLQMKMPLISNLMIFLRTAVRESGDPR